MTINFKTLKVRKVLILSASFLLLFQACKKDGELKPEFAEDTSSINFTDTFSVKTKIVKGDTVLADKISTGLIGTFRDSVFGVSTSSTHVQPLLPSNSLDFGDPVNLSTDSIVLSLEYNGSYGNTNIPQTFEVFRIDELLSTTTNYYSNEEIAVIQSPIGTITFTPQLDTTISVVNPNQIGGYDTVSLPSQLRIKLDKSLGDEILAESGLAGVSDNDNFTSLLKGLKIAPVSNGLLNNNENAILYFALTSSNTKLTLYYTNDTLKKSVDFPISTSSVRFNTFSHDYTGTPVETAIQRNDFDTLQSYTLAMAGVQTIIKFPSLISSLKNTTTTINKAELVLPTINDSYSEFGFPSSVIVAGKSDEGVLEFIPDFFEGTTYFGGEYKETSENYTFNITRYVHGLIDGSETDNGLILLVSGSAVNADRAVIKGGSNSEQKIKLNLYYSNTN